MAGVVKILGGMGQGSDPMQHLWINPMLGRRFFQHYGTWGIGSNLTPPSSQVTNVYQYEAVFRPIRSKISILAASVFALFFKRPNLEQYLGNFGSKVGVLDLIILQSGKKIGQSGPQLDVARKNTNNARKYMSGGIHLQMTSQW